MFESQGQTKQLSEMHDILVQMAKDIELQKNEMQKMTEQVNKETEEQRKEMRKLIREVEAQRTEIKLMNEQIVELRRAIDRRGTELDANALATQVALGQTEAMRANARMGMNGFGNSASMGGFFGNSPT